jgi:cytochrome c-type biogenesis protein CcmH
MSSRGNGEQPASTLRYQVQRRAFVLVAPAALGAAMFASSSSAQSPTATPALANTAATRELAGRLIAPCCWTQTLDIHESPIADQLRAEIGKRLNAGELPTAIEDDLAARYGEKIRAVPRGEDPRVALPIVVGGAMCLAVLWLAWLGRSWLRRNPAESQRPPEPTIESNHYDKQLDNALDKLSERN